MVAVLKPLAPLDAIAALKARGRKLDPTFAWQDTWAETHAAMLTVAKSAGFDILTDIHEALLSALQEGKTVRDFAKELTPTLQAKGWWGRGLALDPVDGVEKPAQLGSMRRLKTIFEVNMRVSYAAGHWAQFQRTKATRPWLRYVAILDQKTRPEHAARHNLCLRVDDPYWNVWAPPCGWNCRCTLQSLSDRDVERMRADLTFTPPPDVMRSWTNKRTGEVIDVPIGIDPGWGYNPGVAGAEAAINTAFAEKVADAPFEMVAAAVRDRVDSEAFRRFVETPAGSMPVLAINSDAAAAIGTPARVALLSDDTMRKQRRRHPELTIDDYRLIPSIGEAPTMILQDGSQTAVLTRLVDGRFRMIVLKTTKTRKAAFVTSYRVTSIEDLRRMIKKGARIIFGAGTLLK